MAEASYTIYGQPLAHILNFILVKDPRMASGLREGAPGYNYVLDATNFKWDFK
jgi:hypothetical protein